MVLMLTLSHGRHLVALGITAAVLELALSIELYRRYDPSQSSFQFAEWRHFAGPFGYHAGADGMTVLFILLTALITLLVVIYAAVRILKPTHLFLATVFAIEATLVSMFASLDLMWFALLSVAQLGLVGYLLWRWATSPHKDMALTRFYQFMGMGLALLLVGTLLLGWSYADATGGRWSFDLLDLAKLPVSRGFESAIFFLLFYGMAIRTPLFPFHGWLPVVAEHGNIAVAPALLLGLKVGIYGMLRFIFPVMPGAVRAWHELVVAFAVVGIFYAAVMAMMQENMRRLLAFAVVSHTGLVVIGMFSLSRQAFEGSVMLAVTFGLAISSLVFTTGLIYRRTRTTLLPKLGGLFDQIPLIGIAFLVASLTIVGMPGTPGFDAAHLVLEAAIERFGALLTIAAALGNVVAAGFLLWAFQRAFLTPRREASSARPIEPVTPAEYLLEGSILVVLLGAGFYAEPWLTLIENPLEGLSDLYGDR
jgi:NADH-quinone oxidoreductase subunit M